MEEARSLRVFDAVKALAFVGDLSMGQPTDHSLRVAWLAGRLAAASNLTPAEASVVRETALLRWSGCTANAPGFADLLLDDVVARAQMLAMRPSWDEAIDAAGGAHHAVSPLARIHCEVSGEVARILGLSEATERALRHIFEAYDGSGLPDRLAGSDIPLAVFIVGLAGDLEALARNYGLAHAQALIHAKAGTKYPQVLADRLLADAAGWLAELDAEAQGTLERALLTERMGLFTAPELIADVADLKLPWMTGYSRRVARAALQCCERLGMQGAGDIVYGAGLIHGIGRAAVPNMIWMATTALSASAWEKVRLVPYWTSRAGRQITALANEADTASYGYERLDGSGYFRGVPEAGIPREGQVLAAAIAWEALRSHRPWRRAFTAAQAKAHLLREVQCGRLGRDIVEAIVNPERLGKTRRARAGDSLLSPRETDVLRHISLGASNKAAARDLGLSPSTVATHIESVFRKLECSTRAAATLKASTLGLL